MFRNFMKLATRQASYGGRHTSVLVPGDGIGQEMSEHLLETFNRIKAPIDFEIHNLTAENFSNEKFADLIKAIERSGSAIKGNIYTPDAYHELPKNNRLRKDLGIFANVVHAKSQPGIQTRHQNVDIYLIRENTEGEYSGLEHEPVPGVVESLKIMTEAKIERIARFAFEFAIRNNRSKVTCIHKANIMKKGDGLFRRVCTEVAQDYPEIEFEDMIVDNTCMQLVSNPNQFDVMVLPNLYGNIATNLCCGLVGGPGLIAGSNYSNTG